MLKFDFNSGLGWKEIETNVLYNIDASLRRMLESRERVSFAKTYISQKRNFLLNARLVVT